MIVSKKIINTTPDGSITLFQLPTEYVTGSVTVLEKQTNGLVKCLTVNEIGGEYIETIETAGDGSELIILYEYNDISIELAATTLEGFKPWDSKRLTDIVEQMILMSKSIEDIANAMKNRISKDEFSVVVGPLFEKIRAIEAELKAL